MVVKTKNEKTRNKVINYHMDNDLTASTPYHWISSKFLKLQQIE